MVHTSIYKIALIFFPLLTACMSPIYDYVGKKVDDHFELNRMERNCSQIIREVYELKNLYEKNLQNQKIINIFDPESDLKIVNQINFSQKIPENISPQEGLNLIDQETKIFKNSIPKDFKLCLSSISEKCIHISDKREQLNCHKTQGKLFYLSTIMKSEIFYFLDQENKDQLKEEISELKNTF